MYLCHVFKSDRHGLVPVRWHKGTTPTETVPPVHQQTGGDGAIRAVLQIAIYGDMTDTSIFLFSSFFSFTFPLLEKS